MISCFGSWLPFRSLPVCSPSSCRGIGRAGFLFLATALAHAGLTAQTFRETPDAVLNGWIALDAASSLFLAITSFVFLVAAFYAVGYMRRESARSSEATGIELPFKNYPEATFTGCCLLFLAAMTLVNLSRHWGLMWVAVEATTLASAPLIYFHRSPKSLEATWKYLMICSVGIALALLGNFFLTVAARGMFERPFVPHHRQPGIARQTTRSAVAQGRLPAAVGRLRDENGLGPFAHLAARRA